MKQTKLPQPGETWWDNTGDSVYLRSSTANHGFPLWGAKLHSSYTKDGNFWADGETDPRDLVRIHIDSAGKVVNPTFQGVIKLVKAEITSVEHTKRSEVENAITAAQERLAGLKDLLAVSQEITAKKRDLNPLMALRNELRVKWFQHTKPKKTEKKR